MTPGLGEMIMASRKMDSPTQPGRGIRKIVDLFHDLPDLLSKASKHSVFLRLGAQGMAEFDSTDFAGMTTDEIDDERRE
jgi:hypothetical protein